MSDISPFLLVRDLQVQLKNLLSSLDLFGLPLAEQKLISTLNNEVIDARLDIRDYELSETRAEQLRKAKEAKQRLEHIRKSILAVSEYNVFGGVEVAMLTAKVEQISERLL